MRCSSAWTRGISLSSAPSSPPRQASRSPVTSVESELPDGVRGGVIDSLYLLILIGLLLNRKTADILHRPTAQKKFVHLYRFSRPFPHKPTRERKHTEVEPWRAKRTTQSGDIANLSR